VEADGITAAELEPAKSKIRSRIVLSSERPRGRMFNLGNDWVYRREYRPVEADMEAIAAVSVDELVAVLAKYPLSRPTMVTIGPLAEVPQPDE
jgi:predicted Zn-dependent peptidase